MNALTAIAATAYALTLWILAPESVWEREVKQAKQNQQNRLNPKPEPMVVPKNELKSTQKAIPESIPQLDTIAQPTPKLETVPTPEPQAIPEATEQAIPTPTITDYTEWTITKLRDEAKTRKLNWRPLINGKRTPLKKPDLIKLLTA